MPAKKGPLGPNPSTPRRRASRKAKAAEQEPDSVQTADREPGEELVEGQTEAVELEVEAATTGEAGPVGEVDPNAADPEVELAMSDAAVEEEPSSLAESDDEPEAAEPAEAEEERREDSSANFLALYFKEMAALSVLRPEEELLAAQEIERLEVALWGAVLANPDTIDTVLNVIEMAIENSLREFAVLRRSGRRARDEGRAALERFTAATEKVSHRLRAIDLDKRILDQVLAELRKIASGAQSSFAGGIRPLWARQRGFQRFLVSVSGAYVAATRAKNDFVKANLRLVVSIARRFNHGRMPLPDLIQEGNIGLIKAVERFDYRRGYRFSTYASWWIRHAISRALADKGRAVRLPVHMIDAYHRIAKSSRELTGKLGRNPTSEEIAEATSIPLAKIEKMRGYLLDQSFSLDRPVNDEDGRRFIDFIQQPEDTAGPTPTESLINVSMNAEVRELLQNLKPIEADILRQRFGLDDDKELTLKEIGRKYNLSRERIRQLQEQALLKMRRALARKELL